MSWGKVRGEREEFEEGKGSWRMRGAGERDRAQPPKEVRDAL